MPVDYKELNAMALWIQQKPNQTKPFHIKKRASFSPRLQC